MSFPAMASGAKLLANGLSRHRGFAHLSAGVSGMLAEGELEQLAVRDPAGFVHERRRLLGDFMRGTDGSTELLADMQRTIDQTIALSGSPMRSLSHLADLIDERLLIIARLSRALAAEINHQEKEE